MRCTVVNPTNLSRIAQICTTTKTQALLAISKTSVKQSISFVSSIGYFFLYVKKVKDSISYVTGHCPEVKLHINYEEEMRYVRDLYRIRL